MMAVLPATAPAKPERPRKVLVLAATRGFVHSSIPLAAKMVEEMGKKTGAWTATDVSYDASVINEANLKQYDLIFLASTTGTFLDDPNDQATTDARRKAFLDFVRGGKGVAGIHAASDSYHGNPAGRAAGGGQRGGGRAAGGAPPQPPPPCTGGGTPGAGGGEPLWPEFNRMIGGYFKYHWNYPTPITVKIDDPKSPINAAFKGRSFNTTDEVYTFNQASFSRKNVHVLTSIDYNLMNDCDKGIESSKRTDGDYALSWIRREGNGRLFYQALGHHESIYYNNPAMLEHILAGIQYALGDLKSDDSPSMK
jgi:type 1 glutamine amidotransferase